MAKLDKPNNKTKILVNVYEPLIVIMKHKFDSAFLKRDSYLDLAFRNEITLLREEMTTPNSDQVKSYISNNLKQLNLKPLNILLSIETVDLMNKVCKEKNIPRDVFVNRFILLLISSDTVLYSLFGHDENMKQCLDCGLHEYVIEERSFYDRSCILDTIEDFVKTDPFFGLRAHCAGFTKLSMFVFKKDALNKLPDEYEFLKTKNTLGFNTFMTDEEVSKQELKDEKIDLKNSNLDRLLTFAKREIQEKQKKDRKKQEGGEK